MPIRRILLDWSKPALPTAVDWLAQRYAADGRFDLEPCVLAVPGGRAGRRLEELLLLHAEEQGWQLRPPRVVTVGQLPEMLYRPQRPFASPLVQQFAWAKALRESRAAVLDRLVPGLPSDQPLEGWLSIGEMLGRLHRELAADHKEFQTVADCGDGLDGFEERARWQALAAVQKRYLNVLDELELWDRQTARRVAINNGECQLDRDLILIGTVDLNLQQRLMLDQIAERTTALVFAPESLAGRFDELGCLLPEAWETAEIPVADEQILLADDPNDQAQAVLGWLGGLGGRYAAERITVGVSPDNSLVPQLQQHFDAHGVPNRWGVGRPLERSSPCRLLSAVAEVLDEATFSAAAALARHPALGDWLRRQGVACDPGMALDEHFADRLPARIDLKALADQAECSDDAPEGRRRSESQVCLHRMAKLLEPLADKRGKKSLGDWAEPVLTVIEQLYGHRPLDRDEEPDRSVLIACEKLRDGWRGMDDVPPEVAEGLIGRVDASTAIRLLLGQLQGEQIPAPPRPEDIELLGWLELPLDDAPALVATGLHEGAVPQAVNADLFLPNRLRQALGITDNARRYARDAYALSLLAASREEFAVVLGRRTSENDPLTPSRLLFACPEEQLPRRARRLFREDDAPVEPPPLPPPAAVAARPSRAAGPSLLHPPQPEPLSEPIRSMRVTEFRDYLACRYRYYLRHRLSLSPVDDWAEELDGGAFGTLAHHVLGDFRDSPVAESTDADEIAEHLSAILDRRAARRYGKDALPAVAVQIEQLRYRLKAFARWQAEWAAQGWRTVAAEIAPPPETAALFVDGEPMYLRGRIDRIDRHQETGELFIFDYKTSDAGDSPEKQHRKKGQWVDLQLPLYRHLLNAIPPTELGLSDASELTDAAVQLGYITLPKSAEKAGHLPAEWSDADLAEADEVAAAVVRSVRGQTPFWPPAEVPPSFSDDFAYICRDGQLLIAVDDRGEEGE